MLLLTIIAHMMSVYSVERVNNRQPSQELSAANAANNFQYGKTTFTTYNLIRQLLLYILYQIKA